jgi:hypothetical protein
MRDSFAVRIALLQFVGHRLELVRSFLCQLGSRPARTQLFRIVEDGAKVTEVHRVGEVFKVKLVNRRDFVGPARLDAKYVRVAGDVQWWVFQRGCVAGQLFESLAEIALLLLVLPSKESPFSDIGPAFTSTGLWRALFKSKRFAPWIGFYRIVVANQGAKVVEMRVSGRALGQRLWLPFFDEFLRRHRGGWTSGSVHPLNMSRRQAGTGWGALKPRPQLVLGRCGDAGIRTTRQHRLTAGHGGPLGWEIG